MIPRIRCVKRRSLAVVASVVVIPVACASLAVRAWKARGDLLGFVRAFSRRR